MLTSIRSDFISRTLYGEIELFAEHAGVPWSIPHNGPGNPETVELVSPNNAIQLTGDVADAHYLYLVSTTAGVAGRARLTWRFTQFMPMPPMWREIVPGPVMPKESEVLELNTKRKIKLED